MSSSQFPKKVTLFAILNTCIPQIILGFIGEFGKKEITPSREEFILGAGILVGIFLISISIREYKNYKSYGVYFLGLVLSIISFLYNLISFVFISIGNNITFI